jgi:hypothetical protein
VIIQLALQRALDHHLGLQTDPADKRRLGDIAHARGLYWELGPQLPGLLAPAGLSVESFFYKGKDWITSFLDMVPALAVRTSLVMQTNKNGTRARTRNDIYDIDARWHRCCWPS